mmetsp:Transcript_72186/g.208973  ORF Transcript_72186/g.208973 Transcript_72186/m.208973 type:complete len:335 (+) Transcript_72186:307-1311(+)
MLDGARNRSQHHVVAADLRSVGLRGHAHLDVLRRRFGRQVCGADKIHLEGDAVVRRQALAVVEHLRILAAIVAVVLAWREVQLARRAPVHPGVGFAECVLQRHLGPSRHSDAAAFPDRREDVPSSPLGQAAPDVAGDVGDRIVDVVPDAERRRRPSFGARLRGAFVASAGAQLPVLCRGARDRGGLGARVGVGLGRLTIALVTAVAREVLASATCLRAIPGGVRDRVVANRARLERLAIRVAGACKEAHDIVHACPGRPVGLAVADLQRLVAPSSDLHAFISPARGHTVAARIQHGLPTSLGGQIARAVHRVVAGGTVVVARAEGLLHVGAGEF